MEFPNRVYTSNKNNFKEICLIAKVQPLYIILMQHFIARNSLLSLYSKYFHFFKSYKCRSFFLSIFVWKYQSSFDMDIWIY